MFSTKFTTTDDLPEPSPNLINQVIGQDEAVEIVLNAVKNKRHALLLGDPGVGKSMMVKAFGELLENSGHFTPYTIISKPNLKNTEKPMVELLEGNVIERIMPEEKPKVMRQPPSMLTLVLIMLGFILVTQFLLKGVPETQMLGIVATTTIVGTLIAFIILFLAIFGATKASMPNSISPADLKPMVLYECPKRPLVRASAYNTTKLLGDIKHCPLGGKPPIGTPPHKRVILGAIHEAHKGILYVDEIKTMPLDVQDYILTAIQDKKLAISGRNPNSSGASVETNPIPCDFTLIMSGNMDDVSNLRAPLMDRIDYKVVLKNKMDNTTENRDKLLQFIVQEIKNNNLNPMTYEACCELVKLAQLLSGSKNKLTLRLRRLSNIIKMANDIATGKELSESLKEFTKNGALDLDDNVGESDLIIEQLSQGDKEAGKLKNVVNKITGKASKSTKKSNKSVDELRIELKARISDLNAAEGKLKDKKPIELSDVKRVLDTGIYSMQKQVAMDYLENFKEYKNIHPNGEPTVGVIHGLAVLGGEGLGDVTRIITKVLNAKNPKTSLLNITGDIAKHSITLASALSKKLVSDGTLPLKGKDGGTDLSEKEIYIQFSQSYSKIDGDSATAAVCLSIISSLLNIPIKQDFCITGSLDLNGDMLAIGGVNEKINAAKEYQFKRVIVPYSNYKDVINIEGIEVIPVKTLDELIPLVFDIQ
ncbi:Lon-like ATP-dependent protease [Methanococcus voltae]|uniref:ATP-dependent protease LonB n=1 Tax=Methanococcus voltae TaxID=2188 RepID=UPI001AE6BE27|nr:ATP-dependent protease LonB [Methanococcus voltae]MBP2142956.1 Lon-like ATP-dependent protease [Methanococcus voltae]